jgi:iron complex outermembrane receptor protein
VGGVSGSGLSNTIQVIKAGYPLNSFLVYKQYYQNGKPVDGEFYELVNGQPVVVGTGAEAHDSITNKPNSKDLYISNKSPFPKVFMALTPKFRYKKWSASILLRGSFGNYIYNNVASQSTISTMLARPQYLDNGTTDVLNTDFKSSNELLSDYYVQNASFVKIDNITLSYDVGKILKGKALLKVSAIVQNVAIFSPYKGLDPEIYGGIDNTIYPRPRIFSLGLNVLFN